MKKDINLYLAWMLALVSTVGSLFFSIYMKLPPCDLCWYQRAFMYPLVVVLGIGFILKDKRVHIYALPLTAVGMAIATYHNLLYYKWIEAALVPCTGGVSCTERQLDLFGFLSIPLMSLISFVALFILLTLNYKKGHKS